MVGVYYSEPKRAKSAKRMARRVAAAADPEAGKCVLMGCSRPTQATNGDGFSTTHCRYHVQRHQRHGSYWRRTFTADELAPYRKAAADHIKLRSGDRETDVALSGLRNLLNWHGRRIIVPELRQRDPETKARAAIGRLQEAGVLPADLLRDHLAITAAVRDEFSGDDEFRIVQIAKAALRRASGYHKKWESWPTWHVYPNSSGMFLRVLGRKLEEACGGWVAANVREVREGVLKVRLGSIDMTAPLK